MTFDGASAIDLTDADKIRKLWAQVQAYNRTLQTKMADGHVSRISPTPAYTQTSSLCWRSRQLETYLEQAYRIYLNPDLVDRLLPTRSHAQHPVMEPVYLRKTDEECASIAAEILRIKQREDNGSTLINFLSSSLLPWPLASRNSALTRVHAKSVFQASIMQAPPPRQPNKNNQTFSWNIVPDILFLYSTRKFEMRDKASLSELGLSSEIIALNGEIKAEAGSALQTRLQLICAGILVLWQRIRIRQAAGCAETSDITYYCFSICSGQFEFWRLTYKDAFEAQQYACDTLTHASGVRRFIEVCNSVMHEVLVPQWSSLLDDIRQRVVVESTAKSAMAASRAGMLDDTETWDGRLRSRARKSQ